MSNEINLFMIATYRLLTNTQQSFNGRGDLTKSQKINTFQRISCMKIAKYMWLLSFLYLIQTVHSISSKPTNNVLKSSFESRIISFDALNATVETFNIPFKTSKSVSMPASNIKFGIYQLNQSINTTVSFFKLGFNLYIDSKGSTFVKVNLANPYYSLKRITFSVLVIDYLSEYQSYAQTIERNYKRNGPTFDRTDLLNPFSSFIIIPYITGCDFRAGSYQIQYSIDVNVGNTFSQMYTVLNFYGSYNIAEVTIQYLILNATYFTSSRSQCNYYLLSYSYNLNFSNFLTTSTYKQNQSTSLIGIKSFGFFASPFGIRFQWNQTLDTSFSRLDFQFDKGFRRFQYNVLVINFKDCTDPKYPILKYNASSTLYECYDGCNQTNKEYLYFNETINQYICLMCSNLCKICDRFPQCKQCINGYDLAQNGSCIVNQYYFLNSNTSINVSNCTYNMTGCSDCATYGQYCQKCFKGYYLSNITKLCVACNFTFSNCTSCLPDKCLDCKAPNVLINASKCGTPIIQPAPILPCNDSRCQTCLQTALNNCLKCFNPTLVIRNGRCVSLCGDGLVLDGQICDDQNTLPYDGCSSDCSRVQDGFNCSYNSSIQKSTCYYIGNVSLSLVHIRKQKTDNKIDIILRNSAPYIREWAYFDQKMFKDTLKLIIPNLHGSKQSYSYSYSARFFYYNKNEGKRRLLQTNQYYSFDPYYYSYILLQITYTSDTQYSASLHHQAASITFSPHLSNSTVFNHNSTSYILPSYVRFNLVSSDNSILQYFSQQYYQQCSQIKLLTLFVSILSGTSILIALLSILVETNNGKQILMVFQSLFIVQFTYLSLFGIGQLNPLFISMAEGLKYSLGIDIILNANTQYAAPKQLVGIGIQSSSIQNNVNLSLVFIFVFLIASLIAWMKNKFYSNRKKNQQTQQINQQGIDVKQGSMCQKRYQIYKILFSNFGFGLFFIFINKFVASTVFQLKYSSEQRTFVDILVTSVVGLLLFGFTLMLFLKTHMFYPLTQKISQYQIQLQRDQKEIIDDKANQQNHQARFKKRLSHIKYQQRDLDVFQKMFFPQDLTKKRRNYILVILFVNIVNPLSIIVISPSFKFYFLIPIISYVLVIIYILMFHKQVYNPPHRFRLYGNYLIGIIIQMLLMIRRLFIDDIQNTVGGQQQNFGLYLPYSILILLMIMQFNTFAFLIYSIKKIRCCYLQIQWENITKDNNIFKYKAKKYPASPNNIENFMLGKQTRKQLIQPLKKQIGNIKEAKLMGISSTQQDKTDAYKTLRNFIPKGQINQQGQQQIQQANRKIDNINKKLIMFQKQYETKYQVDQTEIAQQQSQQQSLQNHKVQPKLSFQTSNHFSGAQYKKIVADKFLVKKQIKQELLKSKLGKDKRGQAYNRELIEKNSYNGHSFKQKQQKNRKKSKYSKSKADDETDDNEKIQNIYLNRKNYSHKYEHTNQHKYDYLNEFDRI